MNISTDFLRTGGLTGSQQSSGVGGATEAPASPETSASGQAADTASLSTAGSAASAASSIGAEVRGEKVSSVQLALADGSYNVPSYEVAGKVIDHMLVNG